MDHSIGKLLPVDGYYLTKTGVPPQDERITLTHLYQPLIGRLPISLYQLLESEYETTQGQDHAQSHHNIMSYLSAPLDQIYKARKKLEAIGLLRTYLKKDEQHKIYVYQLNPPFSAEEFFMDDMLTLLLHHELGEDKYQALKQRLLTPSLQRKELEEVTASFEEVFSELPMMKAGPQDLKASHEGNQKATGPVIDESKVDFVWLHQALKDRMFPSDRILTGTNKRTIVQLATLYNLTSNEIERALTWAINEENQLVVEELKAACHDFRKDYPFKISQSSNLNQRDKIVSVNNHEQPASKEDQFISMLEQISPRELLEDLAGGNQAGDQDLKIIRDVMTEQGLSPGVMNVLVHYVLLKTDMKLSKAYLEKIASHWTRKNVQTVRQAMNLAKAEHQKYQQWGNQKSTYRKKQTKEVLPSWFNEQKQESLKDEGDSEVNTNEMEARIRKLTSKGK